MALVAKPGWVLCDPGLMRNLLIVATLVFSVVGCGKSGVDAKIDDLAKLRDAMCACKDEACTEAQQDKYLAWKKGNNKDEKPNESQMKKFEGIRKELQTCRRTIGKPALVVPTGDVPPPATPPVEGSAAPAPVTP